MILFVHTAQASGISVSRCVECAPELWTYQSITQNISGSLSIMRFGQGEWQGAIGQWVYQKR